MGRRPVLVVVVTVVVVVFASYAAISLLFNPRIPGEGTGVVVSVEFGFAVVEVNSHEVEMTSGVLDLKPGHHVVYESDEPGVFGLFRHYHLIERIPEEPVEP